MQKYAFRVLLSSSIWNTEEVCDSTSTTSPIWHSLRVTVSSMQMLHCIYACSSEWHTLMHLQKYEVFEQKYVTWNTPFVFLPLYWNCLLQLNPGPADVVKASVTVANHIRVLWMCQVCGWFLNPLWNTPLKKKPALGKHHTSTTQDASENGGFSNCRLAFHFPSNPWHHHPFWGRYFHFNARPSVIYFCKLSFFAPSGIKKRKQGLERAGEVKSCRRIIYQFLNLQHVPSNSPRAPAAPPRLCSLWRLFIFHFLTGLILSKSYFAFFFLPGHLGFKWAITHQVGSKCAHLWNS